MATTIYNGPIGDPQSSFFVATKETSAQIGGDSLSTFLPGTAAFLSGNTPAQFRTVRGAPDTVNRAGLAGSDDICNVGHDVSQVHNPYYPPVTG